MSGITTREVVAPATSRNETLHVAQFAFVVLGIAGGLLAMRSEPVEEIEIQSHQVSAYDGLSTIEQGTYNDLLAASLDIDSMHADTLTWPTIEDLDFMYLSPFVQDRAWHQRGKLQWRQIAPDSASQHEVFYVGLTSEVETSGSFLLWMSHNHGGSVLSTLSQANVAPKIWYHPEDSAEVPSVIQDQTLIPLGWREVVTYTGDDELRRLKGEGDDQ